MKRDGWRSSPARWKCEPRTGHFLASYQVNDDIYDVAVAMPASTGIALPLLVVLDGALHFDAVAAAAQALSRRREKTGVGPMVVAGIATGVGWSHDADRRARDLLPGSAAADRMLALIRDQLVADVAGRVAVDANALAIFGHSFGGLFALDALSRDDGPFTAAAAISPSLWRSPVTKTVAGALPAGRRLFIASGAHETTINSDLAEFASDVAHLTGFRRAVFDHEDHGSVAFAAIPASLRFFGKST